LIASSHGESQIALDGSTCQYSIQKVQVNKVRTAFNRTDHELAKLTNSSGVDSKWILEDPLMISKLLSLECNPLV
jgi:hypothetical protein